MVTLLIQSGIYVLRSTSVQAGNLCHSVLTVSSPRSSTNSQLTSMLTTSLLPVTSQSGSSPSCTMACRSWQKRPAWRPLKHLHTKQDDSSGTTYKVRSKHQECSMHHCHLDGGVVIWLWFLSRRWWSLFHNLWRKWWHISHQIMSGACPWNTEWIRFEWHPLKDNEAIQWAHIRLLWL